jgi:hypothetical protein
MTLIIFSQMQVINNLTLNNNFWRKGKKVTIYFISEKVGIGITNPNYALGVSNNIDCNDIYRNGTRTSSTLSLFLPLSGGLLSNYKTQKI